MLRAKFDQELQRLQTEILRLGSEVGEHLVAVIEALQKRDFKLSEELIESDLWVNERRVAIGQEALRLIALQQPMAGDMRFVAAVIEISGELERIHDYVKGIAKINLMIGGMRIPPVLLENLPQMAAESRSMLKEALEAFAARDAEAALRVPHRDDVVDRLFNDMYRTLIEFVMSDPEKIDLANRIEWTAHNMERAADRVTNIVEWTVYMVTGKYEEVESEYEAPPIIDGD